ncbi:helix-turn-helix domain-containing protein [Rubrivirga sp.]|uniref:helix-turn-helix domain-containing protein n=1 Tax=Rubrivirga sp. TaxID=1885344 RepID=UPI003C7439ED
MSSTSSFEADLKAAREARGLSLPEIQDQTRIPVDVLTRFEAGDLVRDPTFNEVYLKAFLRSYAKAVGVSPSKAVTAFADQKAGRYAGSLHPDFDPASAPAPSTPKAPPREPRAVQEPTAPTTTAAASKAPAVDALSRTPDPTARPRPTEAPRTLAEARVNRPAVPTAKHSFDKNWGAILGLFGLLVVGLAAAMYFLVFAGDDVEDVAEDTDVIAVGEGPDVAIDSSGIGTGAVAGPRFQRPISVTVTAGADGLQWFRVTQDDGERTPYWIDGGTSQTFEADSSVVLWGEGNQGDTAYAFDEATVELQGQRFTPTSGRALDINAATGQALLDSLASAPSSPAPAPAGE